jgi:hypothetical protein
MTMQADQNGASFISASRMKRRAFITSSLASGLGASALIAGLPSDSIATDFGSCESAASAYEALLTFNELLIRIQSEAFMKLITKVVDISAECSDRFTTICELVRKLETEMVKRRKKEQFDQLQTLAEIGCASAEQLKPAGVQPANSLAHLRSLRLVGDQISRLIQALLPDGQTILSAEATRTLREILTKVHEFAQLESSSSEARETSRAAVKLIESKTRDIQTSLNNARITLLTPNGMLQTPDGKEINTDSALKAALDSLEQLKTELSARKLLDSQQTAELLTVLFAGVQYWLKNPQAVVGTSASHSNSGARYVVAAVGSAASSRAFDNGSINDLLYEYFPPHGLIKSGRCITCVTAPLKGYRLWRENVQHASPTFEEIYGWVDAALTKFYITCTPTLGKLCKRDVFIRKLVEIICQ